MRRWTAVFSGLFFLALVAGVWLRARFADGVASPKAGEVAQLASAAELPRWAVPYGEEPWRKPEVALSPGSVPANSAVALPARINLGDIVDRVRHAFAGTPPRVRAETYEALVSGGALEFSPHRPDEADTVTPDPGAALRLRTLEIRGGRDAEYAGAPQSGHVVLGNTAQSMLVAGVVEHFAAREAGVDVAWVLAERPPGDLTVVLGVDGLAYAGESAAGHHYKDTSGVARVRIGAAVLVDAAGKRTEVSAVAAPQGLAFSVAAQTLDTAAFPVSLDPLVTSEFGMDNPVETPGSRPFVSVAGSASNYLVVWQDTRSGTSDIYGTLVNFTGEAQHPYGLAISTAAGTQTQPHVAVTGTTYWVVWYDDRTGNSNIYGARVNTSGAVLDPTGVAITQHSATQFAPRVACSSTNCAVVWRDGRGGAGNYDIYGRTVTSNGGVGAADFAVSTDTGNELEPAIASNGTRYLVTWGRTVSGSGDIIAARLETNGNVSLTLTIANTTNDETVPAVAALSGGTDYFVAWETFVSGSYSNVLGKTVTDAGSQGGVVTVSGGPLPEGAPAIASKAGEYLVAWHDSRNGLAEIYAQRIGSAGALLGSAFAVSSASGYQEYPEVASSSSAKSDYLVIWQDFRKTGNVEIYGSRVTATGVAQDPAGLPIFTVTNEQQYPDIAFNGANYLVVWEDTRNSDWDIYGVGVTPGGAVLQPNGIEISAAAGHQRVPAVAAVGTNFLVAWGDSRSDTSDVFATRIDGNFNRLDADGFTVSSAGSLQGAVDVAGNGTSWLVVWQDFRNSGITGYDIYGAQVTAAGAVSPPPASGLEICRQGQSQLQPAVAGSSGGDWLVLWTDFRSGTSYDVYGARVSAAGLVLDPGTSALQVSMASGTQSDPAVAARASGEYLATWSDSRSGGFAVWARTVSVAQSAILGPETSVSIGASAQTLPAVTWAGSAYLVAWLEFRSSYDVVARFVSAGGALLGNAFDVSANAGQEMYVSLASDGARWMLAAYRSRDESGTGVTERVVARRITDDVDGDGYAALLDDCNDSDATVSPGADESCDGVDSDCDGSLIDGFTNTDGDAQPDCIDADLDGDGVPNGADNCPLVANPSQDYTDLDGDAVPDCADPCFESDGVCDESTCVGSRTFALSDSCIRLQASASRAYKVPATCMHEAVFSRAIPIRLPAQIPVSSGGAGAGTTLLFLSDAVLHTEIRCEYFGSAGGGTYAFSSCDSGNTPGETVIVDGVRLELVTGDPVLGTTEVSLTIEEQGSGCGSCQFDRDGDGHFVPGSCAEPDDDCNDADPELFGGVLGQCGGGLKTPVMMPEPSWLIAGSLAEEQIRCYGFTLSAPRDVSFQTFEQALGECPTADTALALYRAGEVCSSRWLAEDDHSGPGGCATIQRRLPLGEYRICVAGAYGAAVPAFLLNVSAGDAGPLVANDACAGAIVLAGSGGMVVSGTLTGARNDLNPINIAGPCRSIQAPGPEVVYAVAMNTGQRLTASVSFDQGDEALYVLTDCPQRWDSCVAAADAVRGLGAETVRYDHLGPSQTVYLVVDTPLPSLFADFGLSVSVGEVTP